MVFYNIYFLISLAYAVILAAFFSFYTRNIQYIGSETDTEKQSYAASQWKKWRWPSDVHKYGIGKTFMKDVPILFLPIFQNVLKKRYGDHPIVTLCAFSNAASAILIYIISANYWSPLVGLITSVIFISCFWIWQIALMGSFITTATTVFLLSVLFIQRILISPDNSFLLLIIGGITYGATMFSSASARNYTLTFWIPIFYLKYSDFINKHLYLDILPNIIHNAPWKYMGLVSATILGLLIIIRIYHEKVVIDMFNGTSFKFLSGIIENRPLGIEHYLKVAKRDLNYYARKTTLVGVFLASLIIVFNMYLIPVFAGFIMGTLIFLLPDLKENLKNYFKYYYLAKKKSQFPFYIDYFSKLGIEVSRKTRGPGYIWLLKVLPIFMPLHLILGIALLLYLLASNVNIIELTLIGLASLTPLIWAEISKAPQLSRSYSMMMVGSIIFFGYAINNLIRNDNITLLYALFVYLAFLVIYNFLIFITDIYPSRMVSTYLISTLRQLEIKEIHAHRTIYNDFWIGHLDPKFAKNINIKYINTISEVDNGWIVIPSTSKKALHIQGTIESRIDGDYKKDPFLNKLLETGQIEKIATKRFKTFGTSRYWLHESEVSSYLFTIGDIGNQDFYRGYAWLIHSSKLPTEYKESIHHDNY